MADPERYVEVAVGAATDKLFSYKVPPSLQDEISLGKCVLVPLGRRFVIGYIVGMPGEPPDIPLKEIQAVLGEGPSLDAHLLKVTRKIADDYLAPWGAVIKSALPPRSKTAGRWEFHLTRIVPDLPPSLLPLEKRIWEALQASSPLSVGQLQRRVGAEGLGASLEGMQRKGWLAREMVPVKARRLPSRADSLSSSAPEALPLFPSPGRELPPPLAPVREAMEKPTHATFLLFGPHREQRRRWYLELFRLLLQGGRGGLLLVPEIGLTASFREEVDALLRGRVAFLHSGLSRAERERQWRRIQEGEALIAIGTRSAAFTPHPRLGLILLDDEQDPSYKQEEGPGYHAREVALARAQMLNIPLLLASATPSLESFYKAQRGEYRLLSVPDSAPGELSRVSLVDMREEAREGNRPPLLSSALQAAIGQRLAASEKSVLLINRRGYFAHLLCRECGFRLQCPRCSVPFVLHRGGRGLVCHQCGREESPPDRCPNCRGVIILYLGPGTQQVEEEVKRLFPGARIARMDSDVFPLRTGPQALLQRFGQGDLDILVGTQMILKALPFGQPSLVALLSADNLLNLPDFRAGERLFSLLMEMAQNRKGSHPYSELLIQTYYPGHYVLQAVQAQDYLLFYGREIASREVLCLPPFFQLAQVEISATREDGAKRAAMALASLLQAQAPPSQLLDGPAPSPLYRRKGRFYWRLLVKGEQGRLVDPLGKALDQFQDSAARAGVGLRVDVDPVRLY